MIKVAQLVKKFTGVMESERLLSCSKSHPFVPELREINPFHTYSISARSVSNIIPPQRAHPNKLLSYFPSKILYAFLISPPHTP
jgi:hypothetical protein